MQGFYLFFPSGMELFVIVFIILLLFGGRKIPELMRGLGKGIREFNSARATIEGEIKEGMKEVEGKKNEEKKIEETKVEAKKVEETDK
jgi:sec-independent protein translocase protein TatA